MSFRNLLQDMRYALRQLRRAPGFAFTVILTLALTVGVATAVFCVIDAAILRPLPFANPDKIVFVGTTARAGYNQPSSWASYQDVAAQLRTFSTVAGFSDYRKITLDTPETGPTSIDSVRSTDNFFQIFGVKPLLGRTYLPCEQQEGKNQIVVLSYDAWEKFFKGDRSVVGKAVRLDGRAFTVVGVMPAGFRYPLNMHGAVYIPRLLDQGWMNNRGSHWLRTVGRIKSGVTLDQAQADLEHVFGDIGKAYPDTDGGRVVRAVPLAESVTGKTKGPLWTLLGAVLAVLAIGCVNIAGLLLARGVKREREMGVRVAIGAGRRRLLWQMLTEGLVLAVLGAASGVLVASSLLELMRAFLIKALARGADIQMSWTVLTASIAVAVVASLAASLYPALRLSSVDPNRSLKAGGAAGTQRGQNRLRSGFVITQVALTLVLVVVSGLLMRVVTRYFNTDLGFDPAHILSVKIGLSPARYQGRNMVLEFYRPLEERISHLPGVQAAGMISLLPIESWGNNGDVHIAGQPAYPKNQEMLAETRFISTGYLDAMGIALHRGRRLSPSLDPAENKAGTVLVNDAFVNKFIPAGFDPTTQRIDDSAKEEEWTRIVGVTGNIRQDIYEQPLAERDWLIDEIQTKDQPDALSNMTLLVRATGDPRQVIPAARSIVHELDPTVPFDEPRTMTEVVAETLAFERMENWLFGIFALLALALALVGLYGLVSHEVEQARRNIGVRMALGATRKRILTMVLSRIAWMLAAGTVAGLLLTVAVRKLIDIVIYIEPQKEVGGFLKVGLLLIAAGLITALIPAARAASIEPMQALRGE
jgi:predicted permease